MMNFTVRDNFDRMENMTEIPLVMFYLLSIILSNGIAERFRERDRRRPAKMRTAVAMAKRNIIDLMNLHITINSLTIIYRLTANTLAEELALAVLTVLKMIAGMTAVFGIAYYALQVLSDVRPNLVEHCPASETMNSVTVAGVCLSVLPNVADFFYLYLTRTITPYQAYLSGMGWSNATMTATTVTNIGLSVGLVATLLVKGLLSWSALMRSSARRLPFAAVFTAVVYGVDMLRSSGSFGGRPAFPAIFLFSNVGILFTEFLVLIDMELERRHRRVASEQKGHLQPGEDALESWDLQHSADNRENMEEHEKRPKWAVFLSRRPSLQSGAIYMDSKEKPLTIGSESPAGLTFLDRRRKSL